MRAADGTSFWFLGRLIRQFNSFSLVPSFSAMQRGFRVGFPRFFPFGGRCWVLAVYALEHVLRVRTLWGAVLVVHSSGDSNSLERSAGIWNR